MYTLPQKSPLTVFQDEDTYKLPKVIAVGIKKPIGRAISFGWSSCH